MGLYHIYFWDVYEGPDYIFVDCLKPKIFSMGHQKLYL